MALSPQTNTTLQNIAKSLLSCDSFVIGGHVSPDGDCIGSALGLAWALRQLGKEVTCVLARDELPPANLGFLPGAEDLLPALHYKGNFDCFIAVDVPTRERLGDAASLQAEAQLTVTIDHHEVPSVMSTLSYTDPDAPSTTCLIWELLPHLAIEATSDIAICCYTGLMTDTGRFQNQNADARAFSLAASMVASGADPAVAARSYYQNRALASVLLERYVIDHMSISDSGRAALSWLSEEDFASCKAVKADAEPMVDLLRSIHGVQVACMLREQPGEVRGSLRAKDDTDVAAIAREFGGGGHRAAAGLTLKTSLSQAVETMAARLDITTIVMPGD